MNHLRQQGNQSNIKEKLSPKIAIKNKQKELSISNRSLQ